VKHGAGERQTLAGPNKMVKATYSGTIFCTSAGIEYAWRNGSWKLPFSEIAVIGECTNELGPFADDYFVCFVNRNGKGWLDCSFYAEGRDALLTCLESHFGTPFELGLSDSTSFKSRVMWPPSLRGEPMFEYLAPPPKNRLSAWLRRIGMKPNTNVQVIAPRVQKFLSRTAG